MDIFPSLPAVLSCEVLCKWVNVSDVGRLDSACCSASSRCSLYGLYQLNEFTLKTINIEHRYKKRIALDWLLSHKIKHRDVLLSDEDAVERAVPYLIEHGSLVQSVCLGTSIPDKVTQLVVQHCQNLQCLRIECNEDSSKQLLVSLPNLQSLELRDKCGECAVLFTEVPMLNVKSLSITGGHFRSSDLLRIVSVCPVLQRLSLICYSSKEFPLNFMPLVPHLKHLRALQSSFLSDAALISLSEHCPLIVHLNISDTSCTDTGILSVVSKLKLLTLGLCCSKQVTNATLNGIAQHCAQTLQVLRISQSINTIVPPAEVWDVAILQRKCVALRTLHWFTAFWCVSDAVSNSHNCAHTSDACLLHVVTDATLLHIAAQCPNLQYINLQGDDSNGTPAYTCAGLRAVAESCAKLRCICFHTDVEMNQFADFVREYPGLCTKQSQLYWFDSVGY